ncbi:hypothetical protein [Streptomyces scopuliridis]|uniref:hypothetical protein n=1 Tax=Streptomyces scopuliridis TaxID=452529 RepID=UPI003433D844
MSTETLTRFRCDAPHCEANGIGSNNITPPQGWTVLKSTAHIPVTKDHPFPPRGRRPKALSYGERCYGRFSLHLCPEHPAAFDNHRPITNGHGYKSNVLVSCSCGASLGMVPAVMMVARYPSHATEHAWFRHLPAELRWYLWRGQRQWATRSRHAGAHTEPRGSEEDARRYVAEYDGTLLFRDSEADQWVTE